MATGLQLGNRIGIWAWLTNLMRNDIGILTFAGVPVNGTSGTGAKKAGPGCLLIDTTNKRIYLNTNTKLSPTWSPIPTSASSSFFLSTEQTGTGASQNVAHGLGVIPSRVIVFPSDLNVATIGAYTYTPGVHTTTNVVLTVTLSKKFFVAAWV